MVARLIQIFTADSTRQIGQNKWKELFALRIYNTSLFWLAITGTSGQASTQIIQLMGVHPKIQGMPVSRSSGVSMKTFHAVRCQICCLKSKASARLKAFTGYQTRIPRGLSSSESESKPPSSKTAYLPCMQVSLFPHPMLFASFHQNLNQSKCTAQLTGALYRLC